MTLVTSSSVVLALQDKKCKQVGSPIDPQVYPTSAGVIDLDSDPRKVLTIAHHIEGTLDEAGLHGVTYIADLEQTLKDDSMGACVEHDRIVTSSTGTSGISYAQTDSRAITVDSESSSELDADDGSLTSCSTVVHSRSDSEARPDLSSGSEAGPNLTIQTDPIPVELVRTPDYPTESASPVIESAGAEARSLEEACNDIAANVLTPKLSATSTPRLGSIVLVKPRVSSGLKSTKSGKTSRFNVVVVDEKPRKNSLRNRTMSGIAKRRTSGAKPVAESETRAYNIGSESSGWDTQNDESESHLNGGEPKPNTYLGESEQLHGSSLQIDRALSDSSFVSVGTVHQVVASPVQARSSRNEQARACADQRSSCSVREKKPQPRLPTTVSDLAAHEEDHSVRSEDHTKVQVQDSMSTSLYSLDTNGTGAGHPMERVKSGRFTLTNLASNSCESLNLVREWAQSTPDLHEATPSIPDLSYNLHNNTSAPDIVGEANAAHFTHTLAKTRPYAEHRLAKSPSTVSARVSPAHQSKTTNKSLGRFIVRTRSDSVPRIRTPVAPIYTPQMPSPRSNSEQHPPGTNMIVSKLGTHNTHNTTSSKNRRCYTEQSGHNVGVISGTNYSARRTISTAEQSTVPSKIPSTDSAITLTHATYSIKDPSSVSTTTSVHSTQLAPSASSVDTTNTPLTRASLALLPNRSPLSVRQRPPMPVITQQVVHTETYAQGPVRLQTIKAEQAEASYRTQTQTHVQGEDVTVSSQHATRVQTDGGGHREYSQTRVYQQSATPQYLTQDLPIQRCQSDSFAEQLAMQVGSQNQPGKQVHTRTHTITHGPTTATAESVERANAAAAQTNTMLQDMMGMMMAMKTQMAEQEVKAEVRLRTLKDEMTQQMHQQHAEACAKIQALEEACRVRESAVQLLMREKKQNFEPSDSYCQDSMLDTIAMQGYDIDCLKAENSRLRAAKCG